MLIGGHDRSPLKFRTVSTEGSSTDGPLKLCTQVHEPDDSAVWMSKHDSQLTEVLVQRDQHLAACGGCREDVLIARVRGPISDPLNLMTLGTQRRRGATPDTRIEQDLHPPEVPASAGSMRSCPTRRLA